MSTPKDGTEIPGPKPTSRPQNIPKAPVVNIVMAEAYVMAEWKQPYFSDKSEIEFGEDSANLKRLPETTFSHVVLPRKDLVPGKKYWIRVRGVNKFGGEWSSPTPVVVPQPVVIPTTTPASTPAPVAQPTATEKSTAAIPPVTVIIHNYCSGTASASPAVNATTSTPRAETRAEERAVSPVLSPAPSASPAREHTRSFSLPQSYRGTRIAILVLIAIVITLFIGFGIWRLHKHSPTPIAQAVAKAKPATTTTPVLTTPVTKPVATAQQQAVPAPTAAPATSYVIPPLLQAPPPELMAIPAGSTYYENLQPEPQRYVRSISFFGNWFPFVGFSFGNDGYYNGYYGGGWHHEGYWHSGGGWNSSRHQNYVSHGSHDTHYGNSGGNNHAWPSFYPRGNASNNNHENHGGNHNNGHSSGGHNGGGHGGH